MDHDPTYAEFFPADAPSATDAEATGSTDDDLTRAVTAPEIESENVEYEPETAAHTEVSDDAPAEVADDAIDLGENNEAFVDEAAVNALFSDEVLVDPYTNRPIRSKADFVAWKERYDAEVAALPSDDAARREGASLATAVEEELAAIRRHAPAVGSLADIAADPAFDDIYAKVQRGYSLADAYLVVHGEELSRRRLEAAERSFRNRLRGKEHLTATTVQGRGDDHVPNDVMAEFRRLLPNAGDEAIRRYYRKDRAHFGK